MTEKIMEIESEIQFLKRREIENSNKLCDMEANLEKLREDMEKRRRDIDDLKSDNYKTRLFKLTRVYDEALSKEKKRYYQSKHTYEGYKNHVDAFRRELKLLSDRISFKRELIKTIKSQDNSVRSELNDIC